MIFRFRKSFCFITTLVFIFTMFSSVGIVVYADETSTTTSPAATVTPNVPDGTPPPGGPDGPGGPGGPSAGGAHSSAGVYISGGAHVTDKEYTDSKVTIDNPSNISGTSANGVMLSSNDYGATGIVVADGSYTFGGKDDIYTVYSNPENNYVGTAVYQSGKEIGKFNSVLLFDVNNEVDSAATTGSSGVDVDNSATLNLNNVYMQVDGAQRYVASNYNKGTTIVNDSYLVSTGKANGKTDKISVPFSNEALLISGSARTNFSIGSSKTYYFNSTAIAEGWAALSTDSAMDTGLDLYAYNTTAKALNGGYGTYADTNCRVWLYGSSLNSAEIGGIISKNGKITTANGTAADSSITQYNLGKTTKDGTTVTAGRNAFMIHAPDMMHSGLSAADCGTLNISNSTLTTTKDLKSAYDYSTYSSAVKAYVDYISGDDILVKSTSADITLDNTTMKSYNEVLVHSVLNSDGSGNFLKTGENASVKPVAVSMSNMNVEGNILHEDYQRDMTVTLTKTNLKGDIVKGTYDSWKTLWSNKGVTSANWLPDSSWTGNNSLVVTVKGNSTWTVSDKSTLSKLTIEAGAVINAKDGYFVEMTVDGVKKDIVPGTYTGNIVLTTVSKTLNYTNTVTISSFNDNSITIDGVIYNYGGNLTMTIDSVETLIKAGTFKGRNIVITCTQDIGDIASESARGDEDYRAALYVGTEGIEKGKSVVSAINRGTYSDTIAEGINIKSTSDNFNGIMLVGSLNASAGGDGPGGGPGGGEPPSAPPPEMTASAASTDTANATNTAEATASTGTEADKKTASYTIKNSTFDFMTKSDGSNVSDFTGYGAALAAIGNARLNVDNVKIHTKGVAKTALYADDNSDIIVKKSSIFVEGGKIYEGYKNTANTALMVAPPWVLGITGNARGTNMLGSYSTTTLIDSDVASTAWGALSTDGCKNVVLTTINSRLKNTSPDGYGTYAIGNAKEYFYGTSFDVGTYPVIITGGYTLFTSYTGDQKVNINKDNAGEDNSLFYDGLGGTSVDTVSSKDVRPGRTINTRVNSQFGVMWHGNGSAILEKGTTFNTKNAAFLIKNGTADIKVDNSRINVEDGTILQMMDNDDNTVGMADTKNMVFNTTFTEAAGFPTKDNNTTGTTTVTASFTNIDLRGNMYNATGYVGNAKGMSITLGQGARLTGTISSTAAKHVWMQLDERSGRYQYKRDEKGDFIQATNFTINEYYNLGHVINKAWFNGGNDSYVTLKDGAKWTVTEESLLSGLTITDGTIEAPRGHKVVMTVNGVETQISKGTYTGKIVLSVIPEKR